MIQKISPIHDCSKPFELDMWDVEIPEIPSYSSQGNMCIDESLEKSRGY